MEDVIAQNGDYGWSSLLNPQERWHSCAYTYYTLNWMNHHRVQLKAVIFEQYLHFR
jgi:hypothetical protein